MNTRIESLALVYQACWQQLLLAAHERGHAWRVMALASVAQRAGDAAADVRSVVIREADADTRTLMFFTDARSPKVPQLAAHPAAMLLAWSPALSWQVRLQVAVTVETSGLAVSSRWARLKMSPGAQDYLSPMPPGTPVDRPVPERGSRAHFAVATAQVLAIDWLELHADGHRRALFDAQGNGRWVAP